MIRNVLLDWSGTVVDDLAPVLAATNDIFAHHGKRQFTREEFRREFSLPYEGFYTKYFPEVSLKELEGLYLEFFKKLGNDVHIIEGAREFLEFCRESGRRVFLLSAITGAHFETQAKQLGIHHYFEHPYTDVLDKRVKILEILRDHALDPGETIFVGDMQHDIETAKHGGVTGVAVLTGYDSLEKLARAEPPVICQSLGTLKHLMGELRI